MLNVYLTVIEFIFCIGGATSFRLFAYAASPHLSSVFNICISVCLIVFCLFVCFLMMEINLNLNLNLSYVDDYRLNIALVVLRLVL